MTGRFSPARHTPVSACQHRLAIEMLLAGESDDLLVVMRRASAQPETRVIGVVDESGTLVGIVPIRSFAEVIVSRVAPEALMTDISDIGDVDRFGHAIQARVVRDVMVEPVVVRPDSTLDEAFRLMDQHRLSGLYVVDPEGRPTGYLDLLELALLYVDALEAPPPPSSG
jgi:CBS domain-containing protein